MTRELATLNELDARLTLERDKRFFGKSDNKQRSCSGRDAAIIARFLAGVTMHEAGLPYSISRERVRQILDANGINSQDGGASIRHANKMLELSKHKLRCKTLKARIWGLTIEEYERLVIKYGSSNNARSPFRRYVTQRTRARLRGISWELSFKIWWDAWSKSGKWNYRGKGGQSYGLAHRGPGFFPDTIYICSNGEAASANMLAQIQRMKSKKC